MELDLTDQAAVNAFFESERPEYVFLAAAKVGGIVANNTYRADFIYQNLAIQTNVIHAAMRMAGRSFCFLAAPASIRAVPPANQRRISADVLSSTPMSPMRSPRSPV